jgi:hypothetical protein
MSVDFKVGNFAATSCFRSTFLRCNLRLCDHGLLMTLNRSRVRVIYQLLFVILLNLYFFQSLKSRFLVPNWDFKVLLCDLVLKTDGVFVQVLAFPLIFYC